MVDTLRKAAEAATQAEDEMNTIHARTGYSLKYWDAVLLRDEAFTNFELAATPQAVLAISSRVEELTSLLLRAEEELRLIRMKDCGAVYDITLRTELGTTLFEARRAAAAMEN